MNITERENRKTREFELVKQGLKKVITTNNIQITSIIRKCYEQLHTNKSDNLDEVIS